MQHNNAISTSPQKTIIITPNTRLAKWINNRQSLRALEAKDAAFACEIIPINTFIEKIWRQLSIRRPFDQTRLLSDHQAKHIWQGIVAESPYQALQQKIIPNIWEAWRIINHYLIEKNTLSITVENHDQRIFTHWLETYTQTLSKHSFVDSYTLIKKIITHKDELTTILKDKQFSLYAFIDFPPLYQLFFDCLKGCEVNIEHQVATTEPNLKTHKYSFSNTNEELEAIINWCVTTHNSEHQIACIIPNLSEVKSEIQRKLIRKIPQASFNISCPLSLARYPMIEEAIIYLKWHKHPISSSDAHRLLQSKYFNWQNFGIDTTLLIPLFHQDHKDNYTFSDLQNACKKLKGAPASNAFINERICLSKWAECFKKSLELIGWGQRANSLYETRLYNKYIESLTLFSKIDLLKMHYSCDEALAKFELFLEDTAYEPQVNHSAPIQILGNLEAAGLNFQSLWLSQMTNTCWPPPLDPNPLISRKLQVKLGIPNACPTHTLNFYQTLFKQLTNAHKNVILSYSKLNEALPQTESNFIKSLQNEFFTLYKPSYLPNSLELLHDFNAPPLATTKLKNGAHALMTHAECPFKGFTELRLNTKPLNLADPYINFMIRGQLFHMLMANLWDKYKQLETLKEADLTLQFIIEKELDKILAPLAHHFPQTLLKLERTRIIQLAVTWLREYELNRDDFDVVEAESEDSIEIEGMTIRFRVDRIDRLATGDRIILDYKTGSPELKHAIDEPLLDPQLPLYLIAQKADGFAFAQVKHKQMGFKGVSRNHTHINGIKCLENWEQQLAIWQKEIIRLISEIKAGVATPTPASQDICKYCDFSSLCRIKAIQSQLSVVMTDQTELS